MTRASTCTTVAQLSRHQTFICYKKSQVRKRDSYAHTSLRSKDKQSNFDCKRGNKNHKPNNNNTTTYRLERVYCNACERHNCLASKRPSVTKKRDHCDTLTYLMALQSKFVERVSERKNKYQISTYITKSTYFRVTTYSCRLKEGGSSQQ